jgi:hypothetical protein
VSGFFSAILSGEEGVRVAEVSPGIGRRRFLSWFLGTTGGAFLISVLYPILRYIRPPRIPEASTSEVEVGPINDPELVEKGFKIVHFGAEPVIVVKLSDTELRAFSASWASNTRPSPSCSSAWPASRSSSSPSSTAAWCAPDAARPSPPSDSPR